MSYGANEEESRTAATYRKLRRLVVEGRLAPGRRLSETELAGKLRVSRTPVRSALQRLEQEGYVETTGHGLRSGAVVVPLTKKDAKELFYMLGAVEGLAARECAELSEEKRRPVVEELRRINRELAKLGKEERPDMTVWLGLDTEFHGTYVEAAGGPRLQKFHNSIRPQAERYARMYVATHRHEINTSVGEHRAIISAIESGQPDWAEEAVENNWRSAANRLRRDIDEMGERGGW
ncbi:MAG: GntR family transcriptional regulator [Gemmatimonadota bacterium]